MENVASDHEGLDLILLTNLCELYRGVLLICSLQELHYQILDLQLDGLRWFHLVVVLKIDV